jgi:hypothetical protein
MNMKYVPGNVSCKAHPEKPNAPGKKKEAREGFLIYKFII